MPVLGCCSVSTCSYIAYYMDPLLQNCVLHYHMRIASLFPVLCSKTECVNKSKARSSMDKVCSKHALNNNVCCKMYCTHTTSPGGMYCDIHYNRIPTCKIVQCKGKSVNEKYCEKHTTSLSFCCFKGCVRECAPFMDYCVEHFKIGLCSIPHCFTCIYKFGDNLCRKHSSNPYACYVKTCRAPALIRSGLCKTHDLKHELSDINFYEEFIFNDVSLSELLDSVPNVEGWDEFEEFLLTNSL